MRALSTRNDDPEHACRPFDKDRDGFVVGEGAGILILEDLEFAKARGAKIFAEIIGYGMSADAYHITSMAPEGEGCHRAMSHAIKSAGIQPGDIQYVNAHATSTPVGDVLESAAMEKLFGEYATSGKLLISSTKSMTGHLLGGAGGLEAGIAIIRCSSRKLRLRRISKTKTPNAAATMWPISRKTRALTSPCRIPSASAAPMAR